MADSRTWELESLIIEQFCSIENFMNTITVAPVTKFIFDTEISQNQCTPSGVQANPIQHPPDRNLYKGNSKSPAEMENTNEKSDSQLPGNSEKEPNDKRQKDLPKQKYKKNPQDPDDTNEPSGSGSENYDTSVQKPQQLS
jgi:hypothetical protein